MIYHMISDLAASNSVGNAYRKVDELESYCVSALKLRTSLNPLYRTLSKSLKNSPGSLPKRSKYVLRDFFVH